jgi:predicted nucleic acid-binding protein
VTEIVVDASVAAMWVLAEPYSDKAATLLGYDKCHAPGHWLAEAVNAVWGRFYRGGISAAQAEAAAGLLLTAPVSVAPLPGLMQRALAISVEMSVTVYDSLYLALAERRDIRMVTADQALIRRVAATPDLARLVLWVGDLA